jgi:hypothetical protein
LKCIKGDAGSLAERPVERFPELIPNRLRHNPPPSSI